MNDVQLLNWDSDFFGFAVAKIVPSCLDESRFTEIIRQLRANKTVLAYWAADPDDAESQLTAQKAKLFLADKKVTYIRDISHLDISSLDLDGTIESYADTCVNDELESLAIQSGLYSRFRIDPKMPADKFEQLYRLWIEKSVNKTIADDVLVKRVANKIVGMVTVGVKSDRGDIGLIAVDESARGMKIGEKLVNAALCWSLCKGHKTAQVVTQGVNKAACGLYEKCGYHLEKTENIYHVWL